MTKNSSQKTGFLMNVCQVGPEVIGTMRRQCLVILIINTCML